MTYEINSDWTREHADEINELNRIVTQEYRVEQEIARKLRIIRECKKEVAKAIESFKFNAVIDYMQSVNWTWFHTFAGENKVPMKEDFIHLFYHEFLDHALYNFIELNKSSYSASTGGVTFTLTTNLEHADEYNTICEIVFNIAL